MDARDRVSVTYRALDAWTRLVALLVPSDARRWWLAEWDGELWYGVAAEPSQRGLRVAVGLAGGVLRDALHTRRAQRRSRAAQGVSRAAVLRSLIADVPHALRTLRGAPGFVVVVAVTLGLGIGATTMIFSVVNALLLEPLPYPDADRLAILWMGRTGAGVDKDWFSGAQFEDVRTQVDAFEQVALVEGASSTMTGRGSATQVGWVKVQSTYLQMIGAHAVVGRTFDAGDDRADATAVALLTYGLWQRSYGGDPGAVGDSIRLDGEDFEIVGVLADSVLLNNEVMPTLSGIGHVDVVRSFPLTAEILGDRQREGYDIVAKLRPGVTLAQAQTDLDVVAAGIQQQHESDPSSGFFIRAVSLNDEVVGDFRVALLVLLVAVAGLLLVACVNVANLLLGRASSRRRELGVRAALGAQRGRLVRQLLTESALLAAIGGGLGVALAAGGLAELRRIGAASLPRIAEIGIDGRVLAFSLAITALTCVAFGLAPAWRTSRIDLARAVKAQAPGYVGGPATGSRRSLAGVLVVAEVAVSLVLLVGGGLLARSFVALQRVDPGFESAGRLTFRVHLSGSDYSDPAARIAFHDELAARLESLPGVEEVGAVTALPFARAISWAPINLVDSLPPQGPDHEIISEYRNVTPSYMKAMGIPLIRGRGFGGEDTSDGEPVVVIDERFAETYFPGRDPVGMRVSWPWGPGGSTVATIVGVAGAVKQETLDGDPRVTTYIPYAQLATRNMYVVVKTAGEPGLFVEAVTRTVEAMDADLAVVDVASMRARLADSLAERRFSMAMLQVFGAVALLLAAVGLYGLVSYHVNQGAAEIGLRMALGAPARGILALVVRRGLALALAGVGIGLGVAFAVTGFMRSMLFGVGALDAWTFAAVSILLVLTAIAASYIPARRATRVDPLSALRS